MSAHLTSMQDLALVDAKSIGKDCHLRAGSVAAQIKNKLTLSILFLEELANEELPAGGGGNHALSHEEATRRLGIIMNEAPELLESLRAVIALATAMQEGSREHDREAAALEAMQRQPAFK